LIGTWIAYEIGCIQAGLAGRPSQGFVLNRAEGRSTLVAMPKRESTERGVPAPGPAGRPSALVDTRVIYCGDCLDQLRKLPDGCVDGVYLWHRFPTGESNSNRNYEVFWGGQSEPRAQASGFSAQTENRHASTAPYIDYMRPRCVELARGALDVRRRI
jgi:hypothetical protein